MKVENTLLCFIEQARPLCEPAELLKLPLDTRISFVNTIGGANGIGRGRAGDMLEIVRERMARQAQGFFTIEEAAQILADGVPGVEVKAITRKMFEAFRKGRLTVRDPGDRAGVLNLEEVSAYLHLVKEFDVDAWLLSEGVGYQFPKVGQVAPVVRKSASGGDDGWQTKARKLAVEFINRDKGKDLYPSQTNIADEIAREFRTVGVLGADGKPLTGSYIKRHALKGISSAQGKQLSTAIGRGK